VARKYDSQALEADALHFSTDVYSSTVVILGLILVYVADRQNLPWLRHADPLAALAVAGIVVSISLKLGKRTVDALVDAAPAGTRARIAQAISEVPGVLDHERIRVRQAGARLFVDLRLRLESNIPFEHAQAVIEVVEAKIHDLFPSADVVVHATPREPTAGNLVERIRAVAHRGNFLVHDVSAYEVAGRINVNLDLEVDPQLPLETAHEQATRLESEIQRELAEANEINIHIEPLPQEVQSGGEVPGVDRQIEERLGEIARETPGVLDCHSIQAHRVAGSLLVRMHCTVEPHLTVARVHDIMEELKFKFRRTFPEISKINIHPEPQGRE
jgi:divalent metal cation (Fe/Co/Zn/Cd) transporter